MAAEGSLEVLESLSDGEGEEERGEGVTLSEARARLDLNKVSFPLDDDLCRLTIGKDSSSEEFGSMLEESEGGVRPRGCVEGVGEVELVAVVKGLGKITTSCSLDRSNHRLHTSLQPNPI
jgi:hypothetical protein